MDGNGRWAQNQGKKRTQGHLEGLKTTKNIVKTASDYGIAYLSLYTFSTENWRRTQEEISFLMDLITKHLRSEYDFYRENAIKVVHSGNLDGLPVKVQQEIVGVESDTQSFTGLTVNLLINYGGRDEIVRAVNRLKNDNVAVITEEVIGNYLDKILPDVDLVIRTAGEERLSNFMLWQTSYAEYNFSPKLWPDFTADDFKMILDDYAGRKRRFGGDGQ
jgi:undecaprenyl diphosphate synthase